MSLSSLSNTSEIHTYIDNFLQSTEYNTFSLCYFDRRWLGSPSKEELRTLELERHVALPYDLATANPKATMWGSIHTDYQPNPRPSFIACNPLLDNTPPPTI